MATRTFHGIKFIKQETGEWLTEDRRWTVEYVDDFETECDEPHPMKISKAERERFYADSQWDQDHKWPWHIREAIRFGKKGYQCPGGEIHFYGLWVAGPASGHDVVNRENTFTDSASHLARFIQGEAQLRA